MTSTPTDPGAALGRVVTQTRHLFLDFDGPICSIFAGLKPETVTAKLRDILAGQAIQLPANVAASADPFDVFAHAATISPELAATVEATMTDLELAAVPTAEPAAYVHEVITSCRESGRTLTIVSNNSAQAVHAYLVQHSLAGPIGTVIARTSPDPDLLKPSPHLLDQAIAANYADPAECTLVGDQVTDILATREAGTHSIGYANKPGKTDSLARAGADAVISSLAHLALALRARPLPN
ncbi:MAG TPA: HAD hydrolase-like protein [Streptosporangiaceae bacterium]|nr:HAD hydrolase-like protein [Streptosporangiaceae bacterium]